MNQSDEAEQIRDNILNFIHVYATSTKEPMCSLWLKAYQKLYLTVEDEWFLKYRNATINHSSALSLLIYMAKEEG